MKVVFDTNVIIAGLVAQGLDPDLLDLESYQGIRIMTPRQWLAES